MLTLANTPIGGYVGATATKAGVFQGVDSAVVAITKQLQPVDFKRRCDGVR